MGQREDVVTRGVIKGKITRIVNYIQEMEQSDGADTSEARVRGEELDKLFEKFDEIQLKIELAETDDAKIIEHNAEREMVEIKYYRTKAAIRRLLFEEETEKSHEKSNTIICDKSVKPQIRLPKLELPHFSGDLQEWAGFKNLFECAMEGSNILPIQRLQYLKSSLRGEAASLVSSLLITEENYERAMKILKDRYENKTIIVNHHLKQFMNYPTITKVNLKNFVTILQQSLDSLQALDLPVQEWDVLLVYIVTQKFDNSLRAAWELSRKETGIPKMEELKDFLLLRVTALELMSDKFVEKVAPSFKPNIKFSHVSTANTSDTACAMCNGPHVIYKCPNFLELSVNNRINYIKTNTLCYNCLQPFTASHKCSKRKCSICHGKHHSLIHITNPGKVKTTFTNSHIQTKSQNISNNHASTHTLTSPPVTNTEPIIQTATETNTQTNTQSHNILHNLLNAKANTNTQTQAEYTIPSSVCMSSANTNQVLLSTAIIRIQDSAGNWHNARALLDSGSEVSIVTHRLAAKLNSKFYYDNHVIQGIGESGKQTHLCINTKVASRLSDYNANLKLIVMDKITVPLPHNYIDISTWNIPKKQHKLLADPEFYIPGDIDVLIGAQLFYSLLLSDRISLGTNRPLLIHTVFGWIVTGHFASEKNHINIVQNPVSLHLIAQPSTDEVLERFWKQEEVKPKSLLNPDQEYCEKLFLDTIKQEKTGHYTVEMPMNKDKISELGESFGIAYRNLLILENKFSKNPLLYQQYKAFIDEFITLGHAEEVPNFQQQQNSIPHCYLPHLGVLRPDSRSTKLRTVVNASSKTSTGVSLNDILFEGPNIYNDVLDILLQFRMYKYAFSCDIVKMFRTIFVEEKQKPFLRILWRDSKSHPLRCIQLKTVTYGTKCAPYLACRTIRHMANQYEHLYPEAAEIIRSECYMDDFLSGGDTLGQARDTCKQLVQLLEKGNFKLHKWLTNNPKVLQCVLSMEQSVHESNYDFSPDCIVKTLGIEWIPQADLISIFIPILKENKLTKRNVLSVIAQMYDPIGILAPVTIKAKVMMQDIWKLKLEWDSILPDEMQKPWLDFYNNIPHLRNIRIPRYYFTDVPTEVTLLGFCDASQKAYGACLYLKASYSDKKPSCSLIMAKTRVAPIKTQSLPRLELCGALLLAQLVQRLLEAFKTKFSIDNILLFTDSQIVLNWIKSPYRKLPTYVSHRLMEIIELTKSEMWYYIHTKSNPADLLTRGISPQCLQDNKLWWNAPDWVLQDCHYWPVLNTTNEKVEECFESVTAQVSHASVKGPDSYFYDYFQKFSNFTKLTRVIAYVLRFKAALQKNTKDIKSTILTCTELNQAHNFIIKVIQYKHFTKEIKELKQQECNNSCNNQKTPIMNKSPLKKLNPFLDHDSIIRLGGRITNSNIPYNHAHPIVLPQKEHITKLILEQYHTQLLHAGIQNTLCNVRLRYWPINGRNEVKNVIHRCVRCIRYNAKTCEQQMADLPAPRVSLERPFMHVGVDFSGAISIRNSMGRGCRYVKGYICLFVCLSTKALHLELVTDLSTQAFICALKRLISRRGICQYIYSDNATNFKGAHNELNGLFKMFKNDDSYNRIMDFCTTNSIQWKFTIPLASHMGGLYEAGIKSVKTLLKRHLNNVKLTYELLYTVLVQIEGVLNSRPLCVLKDVPDTDFVCLTPAHFLIGVSISDIPEPSLLNKIENRLSVYQKVTQIKQKFWSHFYCNYLSELQPRSKWLQAKQNLKTDDVVLLKEEHTPPACWPMGKVISVNKNSKDGLVRSVFIKTCKGQFTRPINKLILLPCN